MKRLIYLLTALSLLAAATAWAEPAVDGEKLVRELWATSATKQWHQKPHDISPAFLSVQASGVHNKASELAALDKTDISNYILSGFRTTQEGPVLVVTYLAQVEETVNGLRARAKTAPRMSVFIKTTHGWQWLAHASVPTP